MEASPLKQLPSELGDDLDNPHVGCMFELCNQLVKQLDQVSGALEQEQGAHERTRAELRKASSERDELLATCEQARERLEENKTFIRDAIRDAASREEVIASLRARLAHPHATQGYGEPFAHPQQRDGTPLRGSQSAPATLPHTRRRSGSQCTGSSTPRGGSRSAKSGGDAAAAAEAYRQRGGGGGVGHAGHVGHAAAGAAVQRSPSASLQCRGGRRVSRNTLRDMLVHMHQVREAVPIP